MKVYLCGLPRMKEPGRGEAYAEAAAHFAARGIEAVSPYTSGLEDEALDTDSALNADAAAFASSDAVAMLGDHVECYETVTARYAGKPVLSYAEVIAAA